MPVRLYICLLVLALPFIAVQGVYGPTNLQELHQIGDVAISSDGVVAYTTTLWNSTTRRTALSLFVSTEGNVSDASTFGGYSTPAFRPNDPSSLFYLFPSAAGHMNVFVYDLKRRTHQQLTDYPLSLDNLKVTPSYVAFTASVHASCYGEHGFECTAGYDAEHAEIPGRGRLYENLFFRHWGEYVTPDKFSVVFTQQYEQDESGTFQVVGSPSWISHHPQMIKANVPVLAPYSLASQIDVSPKYDRIAWASQSMSSAWTSGWSVFEMRVNPVTGAGLFHPYSICHVRRNCQDLNLQRIRVTHPSYSPDGKTLAVLAMETPGYDADRYHAVLIDLDTLRVRTLAYEWDRSLLSLIWTPDGKDVLVTVEDGGERMIYAINVDSEKVTRIVAGGHVKFVAISPNNHVAFIFSAWNTPPDIHTFVWDASVQPSGEIVATKAGQIANPQGFEISAVSHLNAELMAPFLPSLQPGTKFYFPSDNGTLIQGWFFKPGNWKEGQKYPLALIIHGGPQSAYSSTFNNKINPQMWSQAGYAVLAINPTGSIGFGKKFCDAVRGDWGGAPFRELIAGVQFVLKHNAWLDSNRVVAFGISYGGFMVNWLAGNSPIPFRTLVSMGGVYDLAFLYGSTDELFFPEWEFGGTPWEAPEGYERFNPKNHVKAWNTPMMLIHGALDYRVDVSQSFAAFTALQRKGIPSKLLLLPNESHLFGAPDSLIQMYTEMIRFMDEHSSP